MTATRTSAAFTAAVLAVAAAPLAAQLEGEPFASVTVTHDDNIFRFADDAEAIAVSGSTARADTITRTAVGAALQYTWSLQRFALGGEYQETRYRRFEQLDYRGYEIVGGWDFRLGRLLSGLLRARTLRDQDDFADRDSTQLGLRRRNRIEGNAKFAATPRVELRANGFSETLRHDLQSSQNFDLDETGVGLGIAYTGQPLTVAGVGVDYLRGDYPRRQATPGSTVATRYQQTTGKLFFERKLSGLSTVFGEVGYTRRHNEPEGTRDFSGPTGKLGYRREVSGKTQVSAELFRRLDSVEERDANFLTGTGVETEFRYRYSPMLSGFARYRYQRSDFEGSPALSTGGEARKDRSQQAEAGIDYKALWWLTISPGLRYEKRDSSRADRRYEDTAVNIEVEARYD